nr:hypothetical protein orf23 [uncultured bacterium]
MSRVAAFRPPVLVLRGVLRAAPPSAARLRRDGSRKRKRQKIATSQEQCLLPRVTRVQRSRIAANISSITLAGHAARSCKPTEPAGRAWSALRRARIRFRTPRRIQNRPRGNDRRPAAWVRPCDFFACPAVRWKVRAGFFILSRDGGLELFKLLNRSRRSSSAIRAVGAALPAACAAIGAISSSLGRLARRSPNPPNVGSAKPDHDHLT